MSNKNKELFEAVRDHLINVITNGEEVVVKTREGSSVQTVTASPATLNAAISFLKLVNEKQGDDPIVEPVKQALVGYQKIKLPFPTVEEATDVVYNTPTSRGH